MVDVSNPTSPSIAATVGIAALDVAVAGSLVYVASGRHVGLQIFDVSIPTSPTAVGNVDFPERLDAIAVAGSFAYVAAGFAGLQVIDVSNPASPSLLGGAFTEESAEGVAVAGSCICIADRFGGLVTVPTQCAALP